MNLSTIILVGVMTMITGVSVVFSQNGVGLPRPVKSPVSIREGSVRTSTTGAGRYRTRYFVGGGLHGGK